MNGLVEHPLVWEAPVGGDGFAWVDTVEGRAWKPDLPYRALIRRLGAEFEGYEPLDGTVALYEELARTETTEKGILAFANRYGHLGADVEGWFTFTETPGGPERHALAEPLDEWKHNIVWLRETLRLWKWVREENTEALSGVIRWEQGRAIYHRSAALAADFGDGVPLPGAPPDLAERLERLTDSYPLQLALGAEDLSRTTRPGDLIAPARAEVSNIINGKIHRLCGPALYWAVKCKRWENQTCPNSLCGAVWWQLSQAVLSDKRLKQCRECGRFFEVSGGGGRPDKELCSSACRSRGYRLRQDRARAMHTAGRTFKEIAAELSSDVKTVKGWVCGKGKGK